ncbi:hypothetical protein M3Y97_00071200 [Aphelenchoides bicaudatus]|nr:hypothetical protein M3Y97_00071200 [Aphelenchoides bicaudatus]
MDSFEDKHFVVFVMRIFVIALLIVGFLIRFLSKNNSATFITNQNNRANLWLMFALLSTVGCVFGFSLENSVRSANNGSELGVAILLIISLIFSGVAALYLAKTDNQLSKSTKSKVQMMVGMNVLNFITSFQAIYEQNTIQQSFDFLKTHPIFFQDLLVLCISEAVGQLFIYFTIERFGFIVFGLSLIGQRIVTAIIGNVYPITALQTTLILGCLSLLFNTFVSTNSSHSKQVKLE